MGTSIDCIHRVSTQKQGAPGSALKRSKSRRFRCCRELLTLKHQFVEIETGKGADALTSGYSSRLR
jgi:hypothetical protein